MPNPMVGLLYTSADMEEDLSITLEPMDQCRQFWVKYLKSQKMKDMFENLEEQNPNFTICP